MIDAYRLGMDFDHPRVRFYRRDFLGDCREILGLKYPSKYKKQVVPTCFFIAKITLPSAFLLTHHLK